MRKKKKRENTKKDLDDDDEFRLRTWAFNNLLYQSLRIMREFGSSVPSQYMVDSLTDFSRSPIAALGALDSIAAVYQCINPFNWFKIEESGRYAGHSKAYKYFWRLPFVTVYRKFANFVDPRPMINYYKNIDEKL